MGDLSMLNINKNLLDKNEQLLGIDLIYENCEYLPIPAKFINNLDMINFQQSLLFRAGNPITVMSLSEFSLDLSDELFDEYNKLGKLPTGLMPLFNDNDNLIGDELKNRLFKYKDITGFSLYTGSALDLVNNHSFESMLDLLDSKSSNEIYTPWKELTPDDSENSLQHSHTFGNHILIEIKDPKFD